MSIRFVRRRLVVALGIVTAALVIAGTVTVATANLRHVHASGTGFNTCYPTNGASTCHFEGFTSSAYFTTAPDTCTSAEEDIWVSDNVQRDQAGVSTGGPLVSVGVVKYGMCGGSWYTPVEDAWGTTTSAVIRYNGDLTSASVTATVPMTDYYTGATSTVTVNLTWKGIGSLNSTLMDAAYRSGHYMYRTHFTGDNRTALVSGTFSEGATNYAATPTFSMLFLAHGGTLDIIRQ